MKEDWVPAGTSREICGRFYGVKVINAQPGALWRFDGAGLWLPITALHSRYPPPVPGAWQLIEISAPSSGEVRVLLLEEEGESFGELAQLVTGTDSSGRAQAVPPEPDLLGTFSISNPAGDTWAQLLVGKYRQVRFEVYSVNVTGGTSPTVSLWVDDVWGANEDGSGGIISYHAFNITQAMNNGTPGGILLIGEGLQTNTAINGQNGLTSFNIRCKVLRPRTIVAGSPLTVAGTVKVRGFY